MIAFCYLFFLLNFVNLSITLSNAKKISFMNKFLVNNSNVKRQVILMEYNKFIDHITTDNNLEFR